MKRKPAKQYRRVNIYCRPSVDEYLSARQGQDDVTDIVTRAIDRHGVLCRHYLPDLGVEEWAAIIDAAASIQSFDGIPAALGFQKQICLGLKTWPELVFEIEEWELAECLAAIDLIERFRSKWDGESPPEHALSFLLE